MRREPREEDEEREETKRVKTGGVGADCLFQLAGAGQLAGEGRPEMKAGRHGSEQQVGEMKF